MEKSTLIIGQSPDPHIEKVIEYLKSKNKKTFFIDRYKLSNHISIAYLKDKIHITLKDKNGLQINSEQIDKVWWRLKPFLFYEFSGAQALPFEKFRQREWFSVLRSLEGLLKNCYWVNSAVKHQIASKKPYQLNLAKKVGLNIPKTIITNEAQEVLNFFGKGEKIIYKTLDTFIAPPDYMVFTTEVSRDTIKENEVQISVTPCIFQEKVEKKHELRITVVADKLFSAKIDSQKEEETEVDWRKNQFLPIYSNTEIEEDLKKKILLIHKELGLIYGAYDFIIDKNNKPIFLECNPGGQWLWIENKLNLPISEAISNELN